MSVIWTSEQVQASFFLFNFDIPKYCKPSLASIWPSRCIIQFTFRIHVYLHALIRQIPLLNDLPIHHLLLPPHPSWAKSYRYLCIILRHLSSSLQLFLVIWRVFLLHNHCEHAIHFVNHGKAWRSEVASFLIKILASLWPQESSLKV